MTIGVSGAQGSFSEEAGLTYCSKEGIHNFELKHLVSVDAVLSALTNNEIDQGIFPIENSNGGIVIEAVHAMSTYLFSIKHMFEIDVKHCLLITKGVTA
ncbi:MAG: prephenate dehydratase domain-containing protein, partial [bacterium]|nr:prephenate dehydratase domain-containing protein [bacterium]